jgi:hypothetical protein
MKRREEINLLIIDKERTLLASRLDFFIPCFEKGNCPFLSTSGKELYPQSLPDDVSTGLTLEAGGWVRHMTPDEGVVAPIPTRREETSSNTPDVCKILIGWWGGRKAYVLFPGRTYGRCMEGTTCWEVTFY